MCILASSVFSLPNDILYYLLTQLSIVQGEPSRPGRSRCCPAIQELVIQDKCPDSNKPVAVSFSSLLLGIQLVTVNRVHVLYSQTYLPVLSWSFTSCATGQLI